MFGRLKLRKTDTLFSKYLRKKRHYRCERCGRFYPEGKGLQASHFYGRRKESVRFDEENVDVLCIGDHQFFEEEPAEYAAWKLKKLGRKKYDLLNLRAHTYHKRDDKLILLWLKNIIK